MGFLVLALLIWAMSSLGLAAPGQNIRSVNSASLNSDSNNSSSTDLVPTHELNVCDGDMAMPKYYKDYGADRCPPRNRVGGDGRCEHWEEPWKNNKAPFEWDCGSFCQQSTTFVRGPESPYPRSECHYPLQCTLSQSMTSSWNWNITVTAKMQYVLEAGVSGSFGHTWGETTGIQWTVVLQPEECGYFTFIPSQKITRGVLSNPTLYDGWTSRECQNPITTPFEALESWQRNGNDVGVNIFVYTDCLTMEPLPMDEQDEIYRQPGVALPRAAVATMMKSWTEIECEYQSYGPTQDTTQVIIHGKGIQLPDDGAALRDQLTLCGAREDNYCGGWQYEWNENGEPIVEGGTQYWWYAMDCFASTVDMGCVVDAIKKNGGPDDTTCTHREWKKNTAQQLANVNVSKVVDSSPV